MIQSKCPLLEPVKFVVDGLALKIMEEKNDEIKRRTLLKYNFGGNKFYQARRRRIWKETMIGYGAFNISGTYTILFRGVFLGQVFKLVFRH